MTVQNNILEYLNQRDQPVKTSELVEALKKPGSTIRGETTRLKQKGYIEGDSLEGWVIADTGKTQWEKGDLHRTMIEEGVTPRQQFEAIGRRIGIKEDRIVLATDIVWSGEFNDVNWVWEALGQADIAKDLRNVWVNAWRAKLHKGIPPELETELTGVSKVAEAEKGIALSKPGGREYIIIEDEPVRVGENLGDYSLQDAKDLLALRALKSRFSGAGQARGASQPVAAEKVSDLITALAPFIDKGSDVAALKEMLADKLELQKQDILSRIPQVQTSQPKSFIEQITEFVTVISSLKESGPLIRSILGVPESPNNPSTGVAVKLKGPDGQPMTMDLGQVIDWRKFQSDERRADERQIMMGDLVKTARENIPDGIRAILATVEEVKKGTGAGAKTSPHEKPQVFSCADCKTTFSPPAGWAGQPLKCPNPECGREYTKEELLA
ncbi:hypothetical protein ES703_12704 [subsurface metagenome]